MSFQLLDHEDNPIIIRETNAMGMDFVSVTKAVDLDKRTLTIIATDETVDRDGDILMVNGWDFENYKKNPVFLWAHDYSSVPLAAAIKVAKRIGPKRVELTHRFSTEGLNPFADMILQLYHEKIINAGSVGFLPKKFEKIENPEPAAGEITPWSPRRYLKQELLEHSGCPVPCNPSAVQNALKAMKGGKTTKEKMYKYMIDGDKYELSAAKRQRVEEELGELKSHELEFEFEEGTTATKIHQVPADIDADDVDLDVEDDKGLDGDAIIVPVIIVTGELESIIAEIFKTADSEEPVKEATFEVNTILPLLQELAELRDAEPAEFVTGNSDEPVLTALTDIKDAISALTDTVDELSANQAQQANDNIADGKDIYSAILDRPKGNVSKATYTDKQTKDIQALRSIVESLLTLTLAKQQG